MNKTSKRILGNVVILAGLLALLCMDDWAFQRFLHLPHWRWILQNGVEIGFITTAFTLVWAEMNELNTELISPEPLVYIGSHLQLVGVCLETLGVQTKQESGDRRTWPVFETLFALPFILVLSVLMFAWLLVVLPAQYFLFLVCGAPARMLAAAPFQLVVWHDHCGRMCTKRVPRDEKIPDDVLVASLGKKPVAVTSLFVTLFLAVANAFLGGG